MIMSMTHIGIYSCDPNSLLAETLSFEMLVYLPWFLDHLREFFKGCLYFLLYCALHFLLLNM